jgi:hypothetical protein
MQPNAIERSHLRDVAGYSWDGDGGASWLVPECRFDPLVSDSFATVQALGVDPEQDFHTMPGALRNILR